MEHRSKAPQRLLSMLPVQVESSVLVAVRSPRLNHMVTLSAFDVNVRPNLGEVLGTRQCQSYPTGRNPPVKNKVVGTSGCLLPAGGSAIQQVRVPRVAYCASGPRARTVRAEGSVSLGSVQGQHKDPGPNFFAKSVRKWAGAASPKQDDLLGPVQGPPHFWGVSRKFGVS